MGILIKNYNFIKSFIQLNNLNYKQDQNYYYGIIQINYFYFHCKILKFKVKFQKKIYPS